MPTPHRIRHDMYAAPALIADPGADNTITIDKDGGVCPVTTATAEARTLRQPTKAGIVGSVVLYATSGDLTLTVAGGYNHDATEDITFDTAGDFVRFASIDVGGTYTWRVVAQEGTNAATETGQYDTATITALTLDSTLLSVTGAVLNTKLDGTSVELSNDMTCGTGISSGTDTVCVGSVRKVGTMYKTEIFIDMDGLSSGATAKDIIGVAATANCHIGQITAAINGTIFAGRMTCMEAPLTADDAIDLYTATVGTGTEDVDIADLVEAELCDAGGNWAIRTCKPLTAFPAANTYLYLTARTGDKNTTYTAGQFLIEMWGK